MNRDDPNFRQPDLFPDLDWMLQSSQVEDGEILKAIIREHLINLYRLAQVLLNDDCLAFRAACDTIALAVNHRSRYPGNQSGRAWLYAISRKVIWQSRFQKMVQKAYFWKKKEFCEASTVDLERSEVPSEFGLRHKNLQDINLTRKIILYLSVQMNFSTEEICQVTGHKIRAVQRELEELHDRPGVSPEENLAAMMQIVWPLPSFTNQDFEDASELIREAVSLQKKRGSSYQSFKMAAMAGMFLVPILLYLSFSTLLMQVEKRTAHKALGTPAAMSTASIKLSIVGNSLNGKLEAASAAGLSDLLPEKALLEISLPSQNNFSNESYNRLLANPGLMSLAAVLQFWQGAWNYPAIVQIFNHLIPSIRNGGEIINLGDPSQVGKPLYGQLRYGVDPEIIKHLLVEGFPVILQKVSLSSSSDGNAEQYETVIGFDNAKETFYFLDFSSSPVKPQAVPYAIFDDEWRSTNYTFLVIFPPTLERNYLEALGIDVDGVGN